MPSERLPGSVASRRPISGDGTHQAIMFAHDATQESSFPASWTEGEGRSDEDDVSRLEPAASPIDGASPADARLTARALRILLDALPYRMRFAGAAAALGVTPTELEAAFERQNLNPRDHLRRLRLRGLQDDLASGRWSDIGAAFVRWGFPPRNHEVARDYRRLFGCSPIETYRAARVRRTSD